MIDWPSSTRSSCGTGAVTPAARRATEPGSRAEDAADLAGLIEHVTDQPVHVAGNSYGSIVVLTLLTTRPDLVVTATVHEPPLWSLLEGTSDRALLSACPPPTPTSQSWAT